MTKILLVEDDKSLREIYGVRLLAEGYDIISAGDGEEALAMAIKDRPNLILSDVMMPKISGFDMLDILRSTTETKDIKVIMMTALSSEEQRQRGVALGADRYLVKSQVGIEDVVRTVHEILSDAPVSGPAPLTSTPTSVPATPLQPQAPAAPAPVAAPAPMTAPSMPTAPQQAPAPAPAPSFAQPTSQGNSSLPQPTAPFSTPRVNGPATLANRVIQPISQDEKPATPDFSSLMSQELDHTSPMSGSSLTSAPVTPQQAPAPAPAPSFAQPKAPQVPTPIPSPMPQAQSAQPAPIPSGLDFEETPRPTSATPVQQPPQPPLPPTPMSGV